MDAATVNSLHDLARLRGLTVPPTPRSHPLPFPRPLTHVGLPLCETSPHRFRQTDPLQRHRKRRPSRSTRRLKQTDLFDGQRTLD